MLKAFQKNYHLFRSSHFTTQRKLSIAPQNQQQSVDKRFKGKFNVNSSFSGYFPRPQFIKASCLNFPLLRFEYRKFVVKSPFVRSNWIQKQIQNLNNQFGNNHEEALESLAVRMENLEPEDQTAAFQTLQLFDLVYFYAEDYPVVEEQQLRMQLAERFMEFGHFHKSIYILEEILHHYQKTDNLKCLEVAKIYQLLGFSIESNNFRVYSQGLQPKTNFNEQKSREALELYQKAYQIRSQHKSYGAAAEPMHSMGRLYLNSLMDQQKASQCFAKAIEHLERYQDYKSNKILYANAQCDFLTLTKITPQTAAQLKKKYEKLHELYIQWYKESKDSEQIDPYQKDQYQFMTYWVRKSIGICDLYLNENFLARRNLQIVDKYTKEKGLVDQELFEHLWNCYHRDPKLENQSWKYLQNCYNYLLKKRAEIGDQRLMKFVVLYFQTLSNFNQKEKGRQVLKNLKNLILENNPFDTDDAVLVLRIDDYLLISCIESEKYQQALQLIQSIEYRMSVHKDIPNDLQTSLILNCQCTKINVYNKTNDSLLMKQVEKAQQLLQQTQTDPKYAGFEYGIFKLICELEQVYIKGKIINKMGTNFKSLKKVIYIAKLEPHRQIGCYEELMKQYYRAINEGELQNGLYFFHLMSYYLSGFSNEVLNRLKTVFLQNDPETYFKHKLVHLNNIHQLIIVFYNLVSHHPPLAPKIRQLVEKQKLVEVMFDVYLDLESTFASDSIDKKRLAYFIEMFEKMKVSIKSLAASIQENNPFAQTDKTQ